MLQLGPCFIEKLSVNRTVTLIKSIESRKVLVGTDLIHGFCSCWADDHMGRHRKCGGRSQEDTPICSPAVSSRNFLYRYSDSNHSHMNQSDAQSGSRDLLDALNEESRCEGTNPPIFSFLWKSCGVTNPEPLTGWPSLPLFPCGQPGFGDLINWELSLTQWPGSCWCTLHGGRRSRQRPESVPTQICWPQTGGSCSRREPCLTLHRHPATGNYSRPQWENKVVI